MYGDEILGKYYLFVIIVIVIVVVLKNEMFSESQFIKTRPLCVRE